MVNWDPKALTALSDEEVIYKEEHSKLYYLRYYVTVAGAYYVPAADELEQLRAAGNVVHVDAEGRAYAVVATPKTAGSVATVSRCPSWGARCLL